MKRKHRMIQTTLAMAAGAVMATSAKAATTIVWDNVVNWNSTNNTPVSSAVNNSGTTVLAISQASVSLGAVNGVNFSTSTTQGGVTFGKNGMDSSHGSYVDASVQVDGTTGNTAYRQLLNGGWYGSGTSATVSLTGLTIGQDYLVQIITSDLRPGLAGVRTQTVSLDGATNTNTQSLSYYNNGTGSSVVGRFKADATSATFNLAVTASGTGTSPQVNAFQLRAIPEPSSGLMMIAGAVFIGLRRRRS